MSTGDVPKDLDSFAAELQEQILAAARAQYSEAVIRHWMHPTNPHAMEAPDGHARITGPCGDTMAIYVKVKDGVIADASFTTDGCGTSIAAASMAVELAIGRPLPQASGVTAEAILAALDGLPEGSEHCALLAATTLQAAIKGL